MKMNGENGTCDFINNKRNEKKRKSSQGNTGKEKGKRGARTGKSVMRSQRRAYEKGKGKKSNSHSN
jgi:hypothetical protein